MYYECSGRKFSGKNNHGKGIATLSYEKILSLHFHKKTAPVRCNRGFAKIHQSAQKFTCARKSSPALKWLLL